MGAYFLHHGRINLHYVQNENEFSLANLVSNLWLLKWDEIWHVLDRFHEIIMFKTTCFLSPTWSLSVKVTNTHDRHMYSSHCWRMSLYVEWRILVVGSGAVSVSVLCKAFRPERKTFCSFLCMYICLLVFRYTGAQVREKLVVLDVVYSLSCNELF